jgi:hypothetical protein
LLALPATSMRIDEPITTGNATPATNRKVLLNVQK